MFLLEKVVASLVSVYMSLQHQRGQGLCGPSLAISKNHCETYYLLWDFDATSCRVVVATLQHVIVCVWTTLFRNPQTTLLAFAPTSLIDADTVWMFCNTMYAKPTACQDLFT